MSYQLSWTNNNFLTIHLFDSELQQKFLEFIQNQNTNTNNYLVEFFELENLKKIHNCIFATEITIGFDSELENLIDLTNFLRLKKIGLGNIYKFFILPKNIEEIIFYKFNLSIDNLPSGLKRLDLSICNNFNKSLNNLPFELKILLLNNEYSLPLDYLPESLEKLYFHPKKSYLHKFDNLPKETKIFNNVFF